MMSDLGWELSGVRSQQAVRGAVARKLTTMRRVFRDGGTRGLFVVLRGKAASIVQAVGARNLRQRFEVWCEREHWWVGSLVALTGNRVRVDGCWFDLRHPAISTASKSLFLLNGYERAERTLLRAYLDRSLPVIELGGSVGVVACVTNKLLRNPIRHVVVEANPELISVLSANRDRNGCQFTVMNRALAYGEPSTTFYVDRKDFLGSSVQVKSAAPITVPTVTVRELLDRHRFDTCSLVCDIEGGEMELVRNEPQVLRNHVALLIVEIHGWRVGQDLGTATIHTLEELGFRCVDEKDGTYVFRNDRYHAGAESASAC
jgi:FkbM family methyltransferase